MNNESTNSAKTQGRPAPDVWRESGAFFKYRGHDIYYRTSGSGPTLLLLHGFPTASWDWHRIWMQLSDHFRLVAVDFIGYGFSAKPTKYAYSTFDQADLVEALLTFLGIKETHILAHDYGDTVAQELLARKEEPTGGGFGIRSVCFLNGGLFYETIQPRPIQKLLLSPVGFLLGKLYNKRAFYRSFKAIFGSTYNPTNAELDNFWEIVTHNHGKAIIYKLIRYLNERARYRDRWVKPLQSTEIPLRFINGTDDPVSGRRMALRYKELIPNPDIVLLDGIGHYPQIEDPDAVVREFITFQNNQNKNDR